MLSTKAKRGNDYTEGRITAILFHSITPIPIRRNSVQVRLLSGDSLEMPRSALRSYAAFTAEAALQGVFLAVDALEGRATPAKQQAWRQAVADAVGAGRSVPWWRRWA